ncbi:MAG TPA: alpha-amylase family glycosyl hydrolase [Pseudomonadota bacterium]|nr:alpha-amylase family glycosyl hydrolase [Pseudomonadota bacterium]
MARPRFWQLWAVCGFLCGCSSVEPGPRYDARCLLPVRFRPDVQLARKDISLSREQVEHPALIGSWDGFARPGYRRFDEQTSLQGTRYFTLSLPLPPGRYRYGFVVGDELLPDEMNPHSEFAPHPLWIDSAPYEAEWSVFDLPDCRLPSLAVSQLTVDDASSLTARDGKIVVRFALTDGIEPAQLGKPLVTVKQSGNTLDSPTAQLFTLSDHEVQITIADLPSGKYQIDLSVSDPIHAAALHKTVQAVVSPQRRAEKESPRGERADTVLYHVFLDRFRGSLGPLAPPATPGMRAGGTLQGVRSAVEQGYFDRLGVTTLWLSPLYENAPGTQRGRDGNLYEAYHGYWPAQPRSVEPKLGTAADLEQLVLSAHHHGLRVIFDAVPNHLYVGHPYYQEHGRLSPASQPDPAKKSWFSDGPRACVCGSPGCGWGERIEDCWFDTYLPDVNLRNPDAAAQQSADLLWWLSRFDLDGMRIDAVPMMPRGFTRQVVRSVADQATRRGQDVLIIGEDYTGPGDGGRLEIRSFLGDRFDGLHSAFDFPLFWVMVDALAKDRVSLVTLEKQIALSKEVYGGSGAVMGHILNNHDTARFVSEAAGNAGSDPWKSPPAQPTDAEPYLRHMLAMTLLLTLPGIPVLYYGDEVGLAGAGDPDSRRVLPDVLGGGLFSMQQRVLEHVQRLGTLRRCHGALRKGDRSLLVADNEFSVALHSPPGEGQSGPAIVVIARASGERQLQVRGIPPGRYRDVFSGERLSVDEKSAAGITLRSLKSQVFIREDSPCF